jgi:hypothetical protein
VTTGLVSARSAASRTKVRSSPVVARGSCGGEPGGDDGAAVAGAHGDADAGGDVEGAGVADAGGHADAAGVARGLADGDDLGLQVVELARSLADVAGPEAVEVVVAEPVAA